MPTDATPLMQALTILEPLLMLLATWATAEVARWIRGRVKNDYVAGALLRLNDAAATAVGEVSQTTVAELKRAAEDGKLTADEARKVRDEAVEATKRYLGKNGVRDLEKVFDTAEIQRVIEAKIEQAVADSKKGS